MRRKTQKRIALLSVVIIFVLALIPAFYPVEDEVLPNDSSVYRAYGQLYTAYNIVHDFGCTLGWAKTSLKFDAFWTLPNVLPSSAENRAPPS
ncbi:MAG TPA: hypothetical protein VLX29_03515 [Nitrospirota bacterium]|nr:hypothetical protein [Nitrospirota bacterium]